MSDVGFASYTPMVFCWASVNLASYTELSVTPLVLVGAMATCSQQRTHWFSMRSRGHAAGVAEVIALTSRHSATGMTF
ncbi:hypothetical protein ASC82_00260 [Streptomyces sp. Root431]|nr:hypothetical protein ASC82_00260 [Streptomyces sp. Root431]